MSARQPERPRRPASAELLVFLGPSLPAAAARRLAAKAAFFDSVLQEDAQHAAQRLRSPPQ